MILLTVGTQLPFDRLVRAVDEVAPRLDEPVYAQIGNAKFRPVNMKWVDYVEPLAFDSLVRGCSRIVAHAGIGTVLIAQRYKRPLIVFPRRRSLGEHRNDHQIATTNALSGRKGIYVAMDEAELGRLLGATLEPPVEDDGQAGRAAMVDALAALIGEPRS